VFDLNHRKGTFGVARLRFRRRQRASTFAEATMDRMADRSLRRALLFRNIMDIFLTELVVDGALVLLNFMADRYL
jgi:hypothetical protein